MNKKGKKIVLFGQRRNGTTIAFKLFRKIPGLRCYQEPLHPKLLPHSDWDGSCYVDTNKKNVFDEYRLIMPEIKAFYCPLGSPVYPVDQELNPRNWTKSHSAYIQYLFNSYENVLIQPVRVNYHLENVRKACPEAKFIWILRRPDTYVSSILGHSYRMFSYKGQIDTERLVCGRLGSAGIIRRLRGYLGSASYLLGARMLPPGWGFWEQGSLAELLIETNPIYQRFKFLLPWIKLLVLHYDNVDKVQKFQAKLSPDQFALIRYEDLCAEPNKIMAAVCNWLNLDTINFDFGRLIVTKEMKHLDNATGKWIAAKNMIDDARVKFGEDKIIIGDTQIGGERPEGLCS